MCPLAVRMHTLPSLVWIGTGPDGAVAMSSANGLVGTGFASSTQIVFVFLKAHWIVRCKTTTPSSLSLTSNRVTTNY